MSAYSAGLPVFLAFTISFALPSIMLASILLFWPMARASFRWTLFLNCSLQVWKSGGLPVNFSSIPISEGFTKQALDEVYSQPCGKFVSDIILATAALASSLGCPLPCGSWRLCDCVERSH